MLFKIQKHGIGIPKPIETSSLTKEGWKEKDLENYLRETLIHLISDDLMVISQSRPFQPEADLLALDQNAELWFFELKKVATASDNLLQVMRYSQNAASLTVDNLNDLYSTYKKGKCDSLIVDFCEHFGFNSPMASQQWAEKIGKIHHLVVIADGTDEEAVQSVGVWGIGKDMGLTSSFGRFAFTLETIVSFIWNFPICLLRVAKSARIRRAYFCLTQTVNINPPPNNLCWKKIARLLTATIGLPKSTTSEQDQKFCSMQMERELLQLELRQRKNAT